MGRGKDKKPRKKRTGTLKIGKRKSTGDTTATLKIGKRKNA